MKYKIYLTELAQSDSSIRVRKFTETDSPNLADLAMAEAQQRLGKPLVVIQLEDGEVTKVAAGAK